jgi:hypothetical protein
LDSFIVAPFSFRALASTGRIDADGGRPPIADDRRNGARAGVKPGDGVIQASGMKRRRRVEEQ